MIVKEHQKCPKGKKQCGILDSLGNILCLNENQNCPINDIIINAKKEMKGYKSLELNKGKFIHFTNKFPNKFIISDLSVFFQEPCIYPQDNFWDNFIQLENREGVPGCKKSNGIDKRYQYLNDSYNLSLFYQENYILSKYEYEFLIPEKKELFFNSYIKIFSRNYIGINYESLYNSKIKDLVGLKKEFKFLLETKDKIRRYFAKISYDIKKVIPYIFSVSSFIFTILRIILSLCKKDFNISLSKDIIIYILVPVLSLIYFWIRESLQFKMPKRSADEIVNNIYNLVDNNTKFGLEFFKIERIYYTSTRTYFICIYFYLGIIIFLPTIILFPILITYCINKINCYDDKQNLLNEEEDAQTHYH